MKRWNDIQVTSLLTERAPGMIVVSNQGLCSLNVRSGTNLNAVPEKGQEGSSARPIRAGKPTWILFFGEKGVQEMEGYR